MAADDAGIRALLTRLERVVQAGDPAGYLDLLAASADRDRAAEFCGSELAPGGTRIVIQERERQELTGAGQDEGYRLVVDAFIEFGARARVATWLLDLKQSDGQDEWLIANEERVSTVENLYRLAVTASKQFAARNLAITADDLDLTLAEGSVFMVDTAQGVTGLVLIGRGEMRFHPVPETEKGQLRIFAGSDALESRFDAAYIRLGSLAAHLDRSQLVERPVDKGDLRRAERIFREESSKSYALDLADLTRDTWTLALEPNDFLAEIRTRRFSTITYVKSTSEPEDISVFDRHRGRNISVYTSAAKLAARGRFYDEDDLAIVDVLSHDIDVTFSPERLWIDGQSRMRLKIRSNPTGQLTLRLADSLVVRSIVSDRFGRLFSLRALGQNAVLVNLPALLMPDTDLALTITYGGRLEPQPPDREAVGLQSQRETDSLAAPTVEDTLFPRPDPTFLYSNRSYWYPQAPVTDYATATIHITVPASYDCVASGVLSPGSPTLIAARDSLPAIKVYAFTASQPARYLSFVVGRFRLVNHASVTFGEAQPSRGTADSQPSAEADSRQLDLSIQTNLHDLPQEDALMGRLTDVARFYQSLIGDPPYPSFTLTVLGSTLPGGHSPPYFAVLSQPLPGTPVIWRSDPAAFNGFPEFFLAHEVAHQWWGQGVAWRNYHEQWLSEGFAQYFAALYAQHRRGDDTFHSVVRQMRRSSLDKSDQGPVYLGYRIGHIRNDGRVFRSIIYNKGAAVLHMLRHLVGDEAFFRGIRRFYAESRFQKAGTEDLRRAMEEEADRPLERFFERWIYGSTLPRLKFSYRVEPSAGGQDVVLHFEQTGDPFDLPVTVTLQYTDRKPVDVIVPVTNSSVDVRLPLAGPLRNVDVNKDDAALADIDRIY